MRSIIIYLLLLFINSSFSQDNKLPEYGFLVEKALNLTLEKFKENIEKDTEFKDYIPNLKVLNEANQPIDGKENTNFLDKKVLKKMKNKKEILYFWRVTTFKIDKQYTVIINAITVYFRKNEIYINKTGGVSLTKFIVNNNNDWDINSFEIFKF
jgi:hypothetical protein